LIKDISRLGRELKTLVIVDYLPTIYKNYNMNGLAISSWYGDKSDKELQRISILL
jgi:TFIIF-interacting CTD phosphatase-like protein